MGKSHNSSKPGGLGRCHGSNGELSDRGGNTMKETGHKAVSNVGGENKLGHKTSYSHGSAGANRY